MSAFFQTDICLSSARSSSSPLSSILSLFCLPRNETINKMAKEVSSFLSFSRASLHFLIPSFRGEEGEKKVGGEEGGEEEKEEGRGGGKRRRRGEEVGGKRRRRGEEAYLEEEKEIKRRGSRERKKGRGGSVK